MTTGIEVRSLQAGYDDNIVIDELNLTIPKGSITALIGANGCGKSTLLKTICRILQPMGGSVYLDGRSIHERNTAELAREMAILPQQPTAPQGLTVRELVAYGRSPYRSGLWGRLSSKDREMIDWALSATGLTSLADRSIDQLSGGQRQRAWIAMAVAQDTDIVFLDEPTSFLDIAHQLEIMKVVSALHREKGKTIIMVLHELNQAARFADFIVAMREGSIVKTGTPEEVMTPTILRRVFGITATVMTDPYTGRPFCIPREAGVAAAEVSVPKTVKASSSVAVTA